jgi:hypothetical protein
MTEHGTVATGEHRRHPPALIAERSVADGVNTAMKAVQPAAVEAGHGGWRVAGAAELRG